MAQAAREMGAASVEEALQTLKRERPNSAVETLEYYRRAVERLREFLTKERIVDLPPYERVKVVGTPQFLRPIMPFAAYFPPELFGWSSTGLFFVTPPANVEMLTHHNAYAILNTAVHETYPGHHTQISHVRLTRNPARKLFAFSAPKPWRGGCTIAKSSCSKGALSAPLSIRRYTKRPCGEQ